VAIVVETGAIVSGANSYVSVAEADAYHAARGNTAWADTSDVLKEAALIRSAEMLESMYRGHWIGYKTNNNVAVSPQPLAWPRKKLVDSETEPLVDIDGIDIGINSIPAQIEKAQLEAALIELTTRIIPSVIEPGSYVQSESVDGAVSRSFFPTKPMTNTYPILDRLLQGLASPGSNSLGMSIGLTDEERNQGPTTLQQLLLDTTYFQQV